MTAGRFRSPLYLGAFLLIVSTPSSYGAQQWWVATDVYGYSEPVSIHEMIEGWEQSGKGRYAQARARLETGFAWGEQASWQIGVQRRWDYIFRFSESTSRFYSLLEQQELPAGNYPLDLDVNMLESKSIFFGRKFSFSNGTKLGVRLNIIKPTSVQLGHLKGEGSVLDNGQHTFEYDIDYRYSSNLLFDEQASSVTGWGHSIDVQLEHKFNNNVQVLVDLQDAFYSIYWQNVAQSQGCLFRNRSTLTVCSVNFVQDSEVSGAQSLPLFLLAQVEWPTVENQAIVVGGHHWAQDQGLYSGYQYKMNSGKRIQGQYDWMHKSVELSYEQSWLAARIGLDDTNPNNAKYWRLGLEFNWRFK